MKISGLLLCFAGMTLLCIMDAVAKALGSHFNAFQIACVRYGGAALWLLLYIAIRRSALPQLANWRRHVTRALLMVVTVCLFFYGVTHLPLAIAAALAMTAPIYVSILGIVFLRERPTPVLAGAIALGIAGSAIIIIGGPLGGGAAGDISGWIAGLLAPITYAAAIVTLKHHSDTESAEALTLSTAAIAALVLVPFAAPGFTLPSTSMLPLMALVGFLGAAGFVLLTNGLRTTPATSFAIVDYSGLLWAAALGFVFFREVPEAHFWLGGALIVAACLVALRASTRPPSPALPTA